MADMHEIDYKIFGDDMQFVEVELDPGEATVEMETIFGDGSAQQKNSGFMGVSAVPRLGRGGKEEGSVLGALGGLLDGDNH